MQDTTQQQGHTTLQNGARQLSAHDFLHPLSMPIIVVGSLVVVTLVIVVEGT